MVDLPVVDQAKKKGGAGLRRRWNWLPYFFVLLPGLLLP
jgi:hypothetical protein